MDKLIFFGGPGYTPVVGDWNGSGSTKIGAHLNGTWILDYDGNFAWDGVSVDKLLFFGGPEYTPMVGDWNGSGTTKIAAYVNGVWLVDYNGNFAWDGDGVDKITFFGNPGYTPMAGDWNASGTTKVGAFKDGYWLLDVNGNYVWDPLIDVSTLWGGPGYTPVVGGWPQGSYQPMGSISSTPATQTIVQGGTAQYQLTINPPAGFAGTMVLSTSALPAGVSANFSPASLTGYGTSVLTIGTNSSNTPPGAYPITVTASRLGITNAQTTVTLVVTAPLASVPSSSTVIPLGWVSPAETLMFTSNTNSSNAPWYFSVVIENSGTYAANGNVVPANACYVQYLAPAYGNVLTLGTDGGNAWVNPGGTTPGTLGIQIQNSKCTLDISRSYVQTAGTAMTLHLALTFNPAWYGNKEVFVDTGASNGGELYWTNRGSWTVPSNSRPPVTTDHYDVFRTGANVHETALTPSNAGSLTLKKSLPLDNCAWAQPLYVPNLTINGDVHNVLYVATSNATLYAYDADDPSTIPLWSRSLGTPARSPHTDFWDCTNGSRINAPVGIVGAPVIDLSSNTMYVVGNLLGPPHQHKLFGIDIISGAIKVGPTPIASSSGLTPAFDATYQNQRPGLLLADYSVLFGYASYGDGIPYRGWMFNYNRDNLGLVDNWRYSTDVARGGVGIWMSGGGPAFDGTNVYFATGNNVDNDPLGNPDPQPIGKSNSLLQVDPRGGNIPGTDGSGLANIHQFLPAEAPGWLNGDVDLGSSRVIVVPGTNYVLVSGKGGFIYVLNRTAPLAFTSLMTKIGVSANATSQGGAISGGLAYWNGSIYTWDGYMQLPNLNYAILRKFPLTGAQPAENNHFRPYNEQGAPISISSNFDSDGLVWAIYPTSTHNDPRGTGELLVYRADDLTLLSPDAYINSISNPFGPYSLMGDNILKFTPPMIANGRVFIATQGQPSASTPIGPRILVFAP